MLQSTSLRREEHLKKKRRRRAIKFTVIFLVFCFVVGGLAWVTHRPQLRISAVGLSGGILVTQDELETESLQFLSGSYLWIFPKNNFLLYPHAALVRDLREHFKRIATISVHVKDFHLLSIAITERKPDALWCDGYSDNTSNDLSKSEHCYFMDETGFIYSDAPDFSGDAYFKYYRLVNPDRPIGAWYMASSTEFAELKNFIERARGLSIRPTYLIAKDNEQFSLFLAGGGEIYFDTKELLSTVADNLEALLRTPALSVKPGGVLPIEYIDLRFGNKLFYKMDKRKQPVWAAETM